MGSKREVTTGYNYKGSFAQAIGIGPATRLTKVYNGDRVIWSGDLDQGSADARGMTTLTTTLGTLRFYWGTSDQQPDYFLENSQINFGSGPVSFLVPAFVNVIYFVAQDIDFGQQPTPPTLKFDFERQISPLSLTSHNIERDAVLPEVIYEVLTDTLYGAGIPALGINTASFVAACEALIDEGIGASPWIDENTTVREFIGLLLFYIDGYLRYQAGQIHVGLIRHASTEGLPVIDESTLAAEPVPENEGWNSTWNRTRLVFTDRARKWQGDAVEVYEDAGNAVVTGEAVDEEIRMPFVTRRDVAKLLVKRKGLKGGIPSMTWDLEVLPSLGTLKPGDRALLSFAKRGISNRVVRVDEVGRSVKDNRVVKLTVVEEVTRDESHDYVPVDEAFTGIPEEFELASTAPRLSTLTTELLNGAPDGFLVACHRPTPLMEGLKVYTTWSQTLKAYAKRATHAAFPAYGTLKWWTRARNNTTWILRVDFQTSADAQYVLSLMDEAAVDFYACVGRRLYKSVGTPKDEHQVDCLWLRGIADGHRSVISATEIEFECVGEAFGSPAPALETLSAEGCYPTASVYVGRLEIGGARDFVVTTGNWKFAQEGGNAPTGWSPNGSLPGDTDWQRYVKTPVFNAVDSQVIADVGPVYYDRNDTTMCPNGTYSREWGARVPTMAERLDYAGFATALGGVHPAQALTDAADAALYRTAFGFETDEDFLLVEDTDQVLGFMTATGAAYYNKK